MATSLDLSTLVDFTQRSLLISVTAIAFNPTAWNIVARNGASYVQQVCLCARTHRSQRYSEYRNKTITRIFGGNVRYGCYFLALCIFSAGMVRDALYVPSYSIISRDPLRRLYPRSRKASAKHYKTSPR